MPSGDLVRDPVDRDQPTEGGCHGNDVAEHRGRAHRLQHERRELAHLDLAMHQQPDHQRVGHTDRGSFGRREHTTVDATQDHHRRGKRPLAPGDVLDEFRAGGASGVHHDPLASSDVPAPSHQAAGDQQPRNDTGQKELADRLCRYHAPDEHRYR